MNNSQTDISLTSDVSQTINSFRKEVNQLGADDIGTVHQSITDFVKKEMEENPYRTLSSAIAIGFGLGNLGAQDAKNAAIHVAKLISLRALSNLEVQKPGEPNGNK
jgi:hypothetical protein